MSRKKRSCTLQGKGASHPVHAQKKDVRVCASSLPRRAMAFDAVLARQGDPARFVIWLMALADCRSHQSYTLSIRQTVSQGRQIAEARPELRRVRPAMALNTGPEMSSSHCRQPLIDPSSRL